MVTVPALVEYMQLGQFPKWSPAIIMRIGDEIAALVVTGGPIEHDPAQASFAIDQAAPDVRQVLIGFGALDEEDDVTDPLDLLRALLPPAPDA